MKNGFEEKKSFVVTTINLEDNIFGHFFHPFLSLRFFILNRIKNKMPPQSSKDIKTS